MLILLERFEHVLVTKRESHPTPALERRSADTTTNKGYSPASPFQDEKTPRESL
jgi:hypothetical protein